jgi:hypothetical protein
MITNKTMRKPARRLLLRDLLAANFAKGCPQFGHDVACDEISFPHVGHFISGMARNPLNAIRVAACAKQAFHNRGEAG